MIILNYLVLVNKKNKIPEDYTMVLVDAASGYKPGILIEKTTKESFNMLKESAQNNGFIIDIESGFRTGEYQEKLFNDLAKEKGYTYANKYISKKNHSEHETGLAIDICVKDGDEYLIEHDLKYNEAIKWVHENCHLFGFILRYKEGKENITGYNYEPWHIRYVGIKAAKEIYENNITLEEYLNK